MSVMAYARVQRAPECGVVFQRTAPVISSHVFPSHPLRGVFVPYPGTAFPERVVSPVVRQPVAPATVAFLLENSDAVCCLDNCEFWCARVPYR